MSPIKTSFFYTLSLGGGDMFFESSTEIATFQYYLHNITFILRILETLLVVK